MAAYANVDIEPTAKTVCVCARPYKASDRVESSTAVCNSTQKETGSII